MTDLEKIELAIRKVVDHIKIQYHDVTALEALALLAEQIARDEAGRVNQQEPAKLADVIAELPEARQAKVEARAAELI